MSHVMGGCCEKHKNSLNRDASFSSQRDSHQKPLLMAWNVMEPFGSLSDLAPEDQEKIKGSWEALQGNHRVVQFGHDFSKKLFSRHPEIKAVFLQFEDINSLVASGMIMRRIVYTIRELCLIADDPAVFEEMIEKINEIHRNIYGMRPTFFKHFFDILDEQYIRYCGRDIDLDCLEAVRKFWRILYNELTKDLITDEVLMKQL